MGFSAARRGSLASLECTIDREGRDIHVIKTRKPKHPQKILFPTEKRSEKSKVEEKDEENKDENETEEDLVEEAENLIEDILFK